MASQSAWGGMCEHRIVRWEIGDDAGHVRLRSGRVGLVSVDVRAPVVEGSFRIDGDTLALGLRLRLDQLRTRNPLLQMAARSLVTRHDAHVLAYDGQGPAAESWFVTGVATAGDIKVELQLRVTAVPDRDQLAALDIAGSANVGTVHLPLPGLGTVENFAFDVDGRLGVRPSS